MTDLQPAPETLAPLDPLAWQAAADMAEEAGDEKRALHCRKVAALLDAPGPLQGTDRVLATLCRIAGIQGDRRAAIVPALRFDCEEWDGRLYRTGPPEGLGGRSILRETLGRGPHAVKPGRSVVFCGDYPALPVVYAHPEDLPAYCG